MGHGNIVIKLGNRRYPQTEKMRVSSVGSVAKYFELN